MRWLRFGSEFDIQLKIALASFVVLFIELLVIRLVGTEIRIFSYLANSILLAVFTGVGVGMIIKRRLSLLVSCFATFGLGLVLATQYIFRLPNLEFRLFSGVTELLAPLSESYLWFQVGTYSKTGIIIGFLLTIALFFLLTIQFVPLGQYLGELFSKTKKPLLAYSVNIFASILGMWSFNLLSFAGISPYVGLILAMAAFLLLISEKQLRIYVFVCLVGLVVLFLPRKAIQPYEGPVTFWSPYQKLTLSAIYNTKRHLADGYYLEVNNVGYMGLLNLSAQHLEGKKDDVFKFNEGLKTKIDLDYANQYDIPYKFYPAPENVLIIGGGGGNDASAALRGGAKNVDVVEIDPKVIEIGKKYHPESPYTNQRVRVIVDDGRAVIQNVKKKYDLVVMGLADSHSLSSSLTNVQLDNYLYTMQSLKRIKTLLNPGGLLVMSFEVTRPWIGQRMQKTINDAFGIKPLIFEVRNEGIYGWGGFFFVSGANQEVISDSLLRDPRLQAFVKTNTRDFSNSNINVLTDDWPYVYLDKPRIPILHVGVMTVVALSVLLFYLLNQRGKKIDLPFFFLGSGFMLFEFQNINRSAVLFGNTWITSLLIITGVLAFVLLANFLVSKKLVSLKFLVGGLALSFAVQFLVPLSIFGTLSGLIKQVVIVSFLSLPHLFSGAIFAMLFSRSTDKSLALGSNFLGSAIGGTLMVTSYLTGISSLLWITSGFYFLAMLLYFKGSR